MFMANLCLKCGYDVDAEECVCDSLNSETDN